MLALPVLWFAALAMLVGVIPDIREARKRRNSATPAQVACCARRSAMTDGLTPPQDEAADDSDVARADGPDPWYTSWAVPVLIVAITIGLIAGIVFVAQQEQGEGRNALVGTTVEAGALPVTVPYRSVAGSIVIDVALGEGSRTVPIDPRHRRADHRLRGDRRGLRPWHHRHHGHHHGRWPGHHQRRGVAAPARHRRGGLP